MPRFPPQGTFLPDLKAYFSQKVRGLDTSPYDVLKIKPLIDNNYMTLNDLAGFINGVGVASEWAKLVRAWYYLYTADWVARLFSSPRISPGVVASILNDSCITADEIANIFASSYISASRVASIVNSTNIADSKVKSALLSLSADRVQAILYAMADAGYFDRLLNLMTFDASDVTISANTTWSAGVNRYRNITINSGYTLTLNTLPNVILADTVSNSGVIASATQGNGGVISGVSGAGVGGGGAQALIILARTASLGTVNANGGNGTQPTGVAGSYAGGAGGAGVMLVVSGYSPNNGGKGGDSGVSRYGSGGGGGGGLSGGSGGSGYYGAGGGGSITITTTYSDAKSLLIEIVKAVVDWYIRNVLGKTPTTTKSIPNLYGSGGGSGSMCSVYGYAGAGGGGGGSGGVIIIYATSINSLTANARGGNGGNGYAPAGGGYAGGGGGGGGGVIYVFYKTLNTTPTLNVSGGSGGAGAGGGLNGAPFLLPFGSFRLEDRNNCGEESEYGEGIAT